MMARGQRSRRRGGRPWIGYLLSFLFGSLLTLLVTLYLTQERPLSKEAFSQKTFLIDQILRSQFYEIGILRKDIFFRQSLSKQDGALTWEASVMKIRLSRSLPFSLIEENLKRSLSMLGKPISLHSVTGKDSLELDIKVQNRMTHQLTFLYAKPSLPKIAVRPKVAIVIDDLGDEHEMSQEILPWNVPLTLSILPFTPYSTVLAQQAHQRGKEVILHLPMEPHGYPQTKPGEGVLLQEMGEEKLLRQLSRNLEAVPHIKGVSNHMGSRLMEDPGKLRIIMKELKRRGLFFLDSRTTPQTMGLQIAESIGVRAAERSLFLDHSQDPEEIKRQLEKLAQLSLETGKAIGIGHPHPSTLKSLKEMIPRMKEKGIEIVPLSSILE
jgi:polysaccharide deacetylase 2 family uncharacterized protein YibQ